MSLYWIKNIISSQYDFYRPTFKSDSKKKIHYNLDYYYCN